MDMIRIPPAAIHADGMWHDQDLDELPKHIELIGGKLIMMAAQRSRHRRIIHEMTRQFEHQVPGGFIVDAEMAVRIDKHNVPEPDVVVVRSQPDYGPDTTRYRADDVVLAVEVESPSTDVDDRFRKPVLYAKAGIAYYLRVSEHPDTKTLHLHYYRLVDNDYIDAGTWGAKLEITEPWPVTLDLSQV